MSEPNPQNLEATRDEFIKACEELQGKLTNGMPLESAKVMILNFCLHFLKTIAECAVGACYDLRAIRKKLESPQ